MGFEQKENQAIRNPTTNAHNRMSKSYNENDTITLKNTAEQIAIGKLANGFTRDEAMEILPLGPFADGKPKPVPVEGTTEFGIVVAGPPA